MGFKEIFDEIFKPVTIIVNFFVNFFKKLPKLIQTLVKTLIYFIQNLIPLIFSMIKNAGVFVQTLFHYLQNPIELFEFIVQCFIFIPLMTISIFYHIPIDDANYRVGDYLVYGCLFVIYTFAMFHLVVGWLIYKLFLEYIVLRNLDKAVNGAISSFYYRYFLACENEPEAWYMNANYHRNNINQKYLFLAYNTCPKGFSPNGVFCNKNKYYENDFCLEPTIYKAYMERPYDKRKAGLLNQLRRD